MSVAEPLPTPMRTVDAKLGRRIDLQSIDVLRGVAAAWVALYHANAFFWRTGNPPASFASLSAATRTLLTSLLDVGWLGVPLFFVLSGFCIHLPYAHRERLDYRRYAIRRFVRIWIPLAACVPAGLAMTYLRSHSAIESLRLAAFHLVFWNFDLSPIHGSTTTLVGFFPVWSVNVEAQLYVLYAIAWATVLQPVGIRRLACVVFAYGFAHHVIAEALRQRGDFIPLILEPRFFSPARFGEWLLGAWIAENFATGRLRSTRVQLSIGLVIGSATLVIGTLVVTNRWTLDRSALESIQSIGFALLVLAAVRIESAIRNEESSPTVGGRCVAFAASVGRRCYSLYLFHAAALAIVGELAARRMGLTDADKDALGGTGRWLLVTLAGLSATAVVTEVVYRLVELPSHRLARRLAAGTANAR